MQSHPRHGDARGSSAGASADQQCLRESKTCSAPGMSILLFYRIKPPNIDNTLCTLRKMSLVPQIIKDEIFPINLGSKTNSFDPKFHYIADWRCVRSFVNISYVSKLLL